MEHLVFYPAPGIGHLVSMVELAKRFLLINHPGRYHLTILLVEPPFDTGSTAPYIQRISAAYPSMSFRRLPPVSLPPNFSSSTRFDILLFQLLHLNNPLLLDALSAISATAPIRAFILDFFCHSALDIAAQLNIHPYFFSTSGAVALAVYFHLPTIDKTTTTSFCDFPHGATIDFPGVPAVAASDMPQVVRDRNDEGYKEFIAAATRFCASSHGLFINSFEALEPRTLKALSDGLCTPDRPTPPIYSIGPLINFGHPKGNAGHDCLRWLDSQQPESVVFLCFGSMGLFSAEQLIEIAKGLERSGHRFLWVVRSPPSMESHSKMGWDKHRPDPDLDELLPEGFLERTREKGMVVKSWAPQVAVLHHEAVGGFVTHCGWNSILEAVTAGVPMAAWPLYAEQSLNRVFLVEEMKLAVPVREDELGFVAAVELEARVRELMGSEEGRRLRGKMAEMRQAAAAALEEGGSSSRAMEELVQSWEH